MGTHSARWLPALLFIVSANSIAAAQEAENFYVSRCYKCNAVLQEPSKLCPNCDQDKADRKVSEHYRKLLEERRLKAEQEKQYQKLERDAVRSTEELRRSLEASDRQQRKAAEKAEQRMYQQQAADQLNAMTTSYQAAERAAEEARLEQARHVAHAKIADAKGLLPHQVVSYLAGLNRNVKAAENLAEQINTSYGKSWTSKQWALAEPDQSKLARDSTDKYAYPIVRYGNKLINRNGDEILKILVPSSQVATPAGDPGPKPDQPGFFQKFFGLRGRADAQSPPDVDWKKFDEDYQKRRPRYVR